MTSCAIIHASKRVCITKTLIDRFYLFFILFSSAFFLSIGCRSNRYGLVSFPVLITVKSLVVATHPVDISRFITWHNNRFIRRIVTFRRMRGKKEEVSTPISFGDRKRLRVSTNPRGLYSYNDILDMIYFVTWYNCRKRRTWRWSMVGRIKRDCKSWEITKYIIYIM